MYKFKHPRNPAPTSITPLKTLATINPGEHQPSYLGTSFGENPTTRGYCQSLGLNPENDFMYGAITTGRGDDYPTFVYAVSPEGTVVRTNLLNIRHGNSFCYDPFRKKMMTIALKNDSTIYYVDEYLTEITKEFKLDTSKFQANHPGATFNGVGAVTYNDDTKEFIFLVRTAIDDRKYYIVTDRTFRYVREFSTPVTPGTYSGICYCDGYIYQFVSKPNTFYVFDTYGNIHDTFTVSATGELEEGVVYRDKDKTYITCSITSPSTIPKLLKYTVE